MRRPPPFAVLSQNGRRAAYVYGSRLLLIDTVNDQTRTEKLPHEVTRLAFAPDGESIAAANHKTLTLFQISDRLQQIGQATLPASPYRLATGADGTTAATFIYNDEEGVLGVWRDKTLKPVLGVDGHSLGAVLPDLLWLDAPNRRLLIWGQQGPGAFGGDGELYVRLLDFTAGALTETWDGKGLPIQPNGFIMPLADRKFAVYNRDQLVTLSIDTPENPLNSYSFHELEKGVTSPDGSRLAWLWNTSSNNQITYHLATIRLGDNTPAEVISFNHMGAFEQFAIDNGGQITLVYGKEPSKLLVYQSEGETLILRKEIDVDAVK